MDDTPQQTPNVRRSSRVVTTIILIVLAFGIGYLVRDSSLPAAVGLSAGNTEVTAPPGVDTAPLWKAWNLLKEKYVSATTTKVVSEQEMLWGAIEGLAASLNDPYTVFLPPVESKIFQENISGSFGGAGMEIGLRNSVITVIAPLKGSPAERAGIRSGDIVYKIDDVSTEGLAVDQAVQKIRGEIGTKVKLLLIREGKSEPFEVTITRETIQVPTIDTEMRSDGVFVIKFYQFSANSPQLFREALRAFVNANTDKLVIDLRGNPGGYLEAAVDTASFFLPPGKIVVRENFGPEKDEVLHRTRAYNVFNDNLKIVILVNQGSASASEIFAGALQEYGRAKLVGEHTFGKGSVQELVPVTSESSLKVTIARWLTPNGRSISDGGLKPDIEVKFTEKDLEAGDDPQMEKAVEVLKSYGGELINNVENPFEQSGLSQPTTTP